jgi:hypothetical protein
MSIKGSLTDVSLLEIFQLIQNGRKTGLLKLSAFPEIPTTPPSVHYLWVEQGSLVGAANRLDQQGLVNLIAQYPWVSDRVVTKLAQFCPTDKPLGLYLKNQGALQAEQLEHIFQVQVAQSLCALFQLKDAQFKFDQNVPIPMQEMTGLSVPPTVLKAMLQKLIWLEKLFEAKKLRVERSGASSNCDNFCHQLGLILDIAFFHSLNFSLLDTKNSFSKLSQVFDLCDRPYDLPKSRKAQAIGCQGK